jgi:hypothetical protein
MANIANIVLADGQASPANVTFVPQDCTSELASWTNPASGISIGMPTVSLSLKLGRNGEANKVTAKVVVPTLEVISGSVAGYTAAPQVAYTCLGKVELTLPARSTLQNRKDLKAFLIGMVENSFTADAVEQYQRPY